MITRQELYELVWSVPSSRAAMRLEVSDSYLGRICRALDVPKPSAAWWAKQSVGRAPPPPPLPKSKPGFPNSWAKAQSGTPALKQYYKGERRFIGPPTWEVYNTHPLVNRARELLRDARSSDDGTHLVVHNPDALDLTCSADVVENALLLATALIGSCNARGHPVHIAGGYGLIRPVLSNVIGPVTHTRRWPGVLWAPKAPMVAIVSGVPIGFAIMESCEEALMRYVGFGKYDRASAVRRVAGVTWTEWRRDLTGRLKIIAYSPRFATPWQREWTETRPNSLIRRIDAILVELEQSAHRLPHASAYLRGT